MKKPRGSESGEHTGTRSSLREPVGTHDRGVYVRRRIVVLLGIVAIIVAVVLIILRPGGSGGAAGAKEVNVPTDLVVKPEETPTDTVAETPACSNSKLRVTAVTDQPSYGADEDPQLSLTVENIGKEACIADLGTTGMTFTVTSGSDEVWRSTDCQTNPSSTLVILDPKTPLETEAISWDRTRSSAETCDIDRDPVIAGGASYHLQATASDVKSTDTAQFLLY